jgi:hypothetical protein
MIATHDQFTRQMRSRLKTSAIGLRLVRLLQELKRFEEARTIFSSLENGFRDVAVELATPGQESRASTENVPFRESCIGIKRQHTSSLQVVGTNLGSDLSNFEWHSVH